MTENKATNKSEFPHSATCDGWECVMTVKQLTISISMIDCHKITEKRTTKTFAHEWKD